jgi:hypothetical protein
MPLYWTIDSRACLVSAKAEGDVSLDHALRLLEAISGACALSYRKLFDNRAGMSSMNGEELLTLCVKVRSYHARGPMGPLAVVATPDQTLIFARLLGVLAAADRRMKVFDSLRQARKWIDDQDCAPVAHLPAPAKARVETAVAP